VRFRLRGCAIVVVLALGVSDDSRLHCWVVIIALLVTSLVSKARDSRLHGWIALVAIAVCTVMQLNSRLQ
jgi:hypothetical protein